MLGAQILDYLGGSNVHKSRHLIVSKNNEGGGVVAMLQQGAFSATVKHKVVRVQWQEASSRSLGKAAAGAIVGGVLTGGLGLIAGAAIGGRKKDQSVAIITVDVKGEEHELYVRCNQKQFREITSW